MWHYRYRFGGDRKQPFAKPQFRGLQREETPQTSARRSPRTVIFLQNHSKLLQGHAPGRMTQTASLSYG